MKTNNINTLIFFKQFKDFISLYNKLTSMCFGCCVDTLTGREITNEEVSRNKRKTEGLL